MIRVCKFLYFIVFAILCNSCASSKSQKEILGFDFSEKETVFSFLIKEKEKYYITLSNNLVAEQKSVIEEVNHEILAICLSRLGDSLFYVRKEFNSDLYEIILYDINTHKQSILLSDLVYISEIVTLNSKLYFLASNTIKSYSPITTDRPHGFDLFSIDIKQNEIKKLTTESAYSMNNLRIIDSSNVSCILGHSELLNLNLSEDSLYKTNVKELINEKFFFLSRFDICKKEKKLLLYSNYKFYISTFGEIPKVQEKFRVDSHIKQLKFSEKECILYFLPTASSDKIFKYSIDENKILGTLN